ncbi:MAG: guided entry of tail-anchored proteins factor 1 [Desulfobulbus sp.]|nr:guided entry of tail-anchored proteins factor 1 [Desulfobulbus sp.]
MPCSAVPGSSTCRPVAQAGASQAELERKIDELSRQLEALKAQVGKQNETILTNRLRAQHAGQGDRGC